MRSDRNQDENRSDYEAEETNNGCPGRDISHRAYRRVRQESDIEGDTGAAQR
jgi:hypothetical protein